MTIRINAMAVAAIGIAACASSRADPPARGPAPVEPASVAPVVAEQPARQEPEPGRFTVFTAGDVFLGKQAQHEIRTQGLDYPFARVVDEIEKHDVAFANLESPITDRKVESYGWKKYHLKVDPGQGRALERSGLDVVSLANNHMMDFGEQALEDTLSHLDAMGIRHAGAGRDEEEAGEPAVIEVGGTQVVFLAYCAWPGASMHARGDRPGVASLRVEEVVEDVTRWKGEDRAVIVSLHWGVQHTDRATKRQIEWAHEIAEAGASAVIGHHPHRPQDVEVHGGVPIVYSLGNFLFGYYNPVYRNNIAAVLEFEGSRVVGVRLLPVDGRNARIRFQPAFLDGKLGLSVLRKLETVSRRHGTKMTIGGDEARLVLE